MKRQTLTLIACAFFLVSGAIGANAEEGSGLNDHDDHAMMGPENGMGCGMMERGMMHSGGMMGRGVAMRFIFALMDSDGDGTVSLQEFQAAHERIFKAMDVDKDGTLTLEEIQAFMRGTNKLSPKGHECE
jgi:EF hand